MSRRVVLAGLALPLLLLFAPGQGHAPPPAPPPAAPPLVRRKQKSTGERRPVTFTARHKPGSGHSTPAEVPRTLPTLAAAWEGKLRDTGSTLDQIFDWLMGLLRQWNASGVIAVDCQHPVILAGAPASGPLEPIPVLQYPWYCRPACSFKTPQKVSVAVPCADFRTAPNNRARWRLLRKLQAEGNWPYQWRGVRADERCSKDDRWRTLPHGPGRPSPGKGALAATQRLALQYCRRSVAGQEAAAAPRRVFVDLGAREPPPDLRQAADWTFGGRADLARAGVHLPEAAFQTEHFRYPVPFDVLHAFEMAPRYYPAWRAVAARTAPPEVHFHAAAVGVEDGQISVTADRNESMDSLIGSCADSNASPDCKEKEKSRVTVPVVDVVAWLQRNVQPSDWVVLKVDIEGMEWLVVPRLLHSGVLKRLVDEVYVELHDREGFEHIGSLRHSRFVNKTQRRWNWECESQRCNVAALAALRDAGIKVHDWG
eukprot:TRINITY_DN6643_c4_g1_i1.p2 TRINITY_DN6643_c4_g1~~TRINITY_DN6643_c4_g1_i1.p2  ORF type:complete len:483 (+),score=159.66 TRINITY_DN6643_c4_g1_i1:48-1496(+)